MGQLFFPEENQKKFQLQQSFMPLRTKAVRVKSVFDNVMGTYKTRKTRTNKRCKNGYHKQKPVCVRKNKLRNVRSGKCPKGSRYRQELHMCENIEKMDRNFDFYGQRVKPLPSLSSFSPAAPAAGGTRRRRR